jgi:hypothetical protein
MRLVLLAIQMSFLALPLFAADLSRYVAQDVLARLRAGETISHSVPSDGTLTLLPSVGSKETISEQIKAFHLSVGVEVVRMISGTAERMDSPSSWLRIYNAMHAVSTMQGIKYYSVTHHDVRVLFTESYAISSAEDQARVADPVFKSIPLDNIIYSLQRDSAFGRNAYEERFAFKGDHLVVSMENLTTISILLLPFIQPRGMVSDVVVVPAGNEILFYGLAYVRSSLGIGDRQDREASFANRLIAMENWLKAELLPGSQG